MVQKSIDDCGKMIDCYLKQKLIGKFQSFEYFVAFDLIFSWGYSSKNQSFFLAREIRAFRPNVLRAESESQRRDFRYHSQVYNGDQREDEGLG